RPHRLSASHPGRATVPERGATSHDGAAAAAHRDRGGHQPGAAAHRRGRLVAMTRKRGGDAALFNLPPRAKGRVELALDKALSAARAAGGLTDVDLAVLTLARAQARGVDCAEADR